MKVLSLFSGVGGFDMGLEQAGMQTVFQCEWDKHANTILHKHWPTVPKWEDIPTLTGAHILQHAPIIDVVAWGSPCQDLSVAGKRAGLEGSRSGLFHEGVRIIKELKELTNGKYPRISIWENVAGALSSNKGADFGIILDEMAEAGALVQEWRLLDAQYFGIPQRRRRVFLISVFDPATTANCCDPLLPVSEGVCWNPSTSATPRQEPASETTAGLGSGREVANTISASLYHHGTVVNQDANNGHVIVGSLAARDYKGVGNQYIQENKCVVETIVFENSYRDSARIGDSKVTNTLSAKMGTGGNNVPMLAFPIQDGREIEKHQNGIGIADEGSPAYTLDQTGAQAVAYSLDSLASNSMKSSNPDSGCREVDITRTLDTARPDPSCNQGGIAIVEPVTYGIQGTVIGRQDHNGPGGKGYSNPDDPMFTLTSTDIHAVIQYDGYNQKIHADDVSVTLRIGRDSSDFVAQPAESTMAVRRLTPLECERLMGWPDDHTRWKADGTEQADTHRYKQCGNGVASPVAQWIGEQLINL